MENELQNIIEILKKYKQEHLLNFYDELEDSQKASLIKQIQSINFEQITNMYIRSKLDDSINSSRISPVPYIVKSSLTKENNGYYSNIGNTVIKQGKLAVITLAGGQGTRLGYKGPKGSYEIDIPPKKSLFEFACDNLKKIKNKYDVELNWYIMTSPSNDKQTKSYFEKNNFFGYSQEKVKFFIQGTLPVIDINGKIILERTYIIKEESNGNGDVFSSLNNSNLISDLMENSIEWVSIGGIDNLLLQPTDSVFLGLAIAEKYNVASKSIRKNDLLSSDWVFANVDGKPCIVDPSNLTDDMKTDKYCQTNMLSHLFSLDAIKALANVDFPYHRAFKRNDFINEEGMKEVPIHPNSFKFEKFIFDAFYHFDKLLLLEVNPDEEFAPIKSFTGNATPETALELYKKYHNL